MGGVSGVVGGGGVDGGDDGGGGGVDGGVDGDGGGVDGGDDDDGVVCCFTHCGSDQRVGVSPLTLITYRPLSCAISIL